MNESEVGIIFPILCRSQTEGLARIASDNWICSQK